MRLAAILCILAFMLNACNTALRGRPGYDEPAIKGAITPSLSITYDDEYVECLQVRGPKTISTGNETQKDPYCEAIAKRNLFLDINILKIDSVYNEYAFQLFTGDQHQRLATDLANIGLSTSIALVGGAAAKTILGVTSGAFNSALVSFDRDILVEKTMPVLLLKMNKLRTDKRQKIMEKRKLPLDEYTMVAATNDIEEFKKFGTLPGALLAMYSESDAELDKLNEEIKKMRAGSTFETVKWVEIENVGLKIKIMEDSKFSEFIKKLPIDDKGRLESIETLLKATKVISNQRGIVITFLPLVITSMDSLEKWKKAVEKTIAAK